MTNLPLEGYVWHSNGDCLVIVWDGRAPILMNQAVLLCEILKKRLKITSSISAPDQHFNAIVRYTYKYEEFPREFRLEMS